MPQRTESVLETTGGFTQYLSNSKCSVSAYIHIKMNDFKIYCVVQLEKYVPNNGYYLLQPLYNLSATLYVATTNKHFSETKQTLFTSYTPIIYV